MADPEAVKRELDRLAGGEAADAGAARTIARASVAVEDLERAAAYRRAVGLRRLSRAVAAAGRDGDRDLARRGQRALAAFQRLRRACAGGVDDERGEDGE